MNENKPDKKDVIDAITSKILSITDSISDYEKDDLSPVKMKSDCLISLAQLENLINNVEVFSMADPKILTLICGKHYISLKHAYPMLISNGMQKEYYQLYEKATSGELLDITEKAKELGTHINNYMITIWS